MNEQPVADEGEVILINKPLHWTSFDVANKIKKSCQIKKIGHAGTLDPLATGLLILCTGKKTKQIDTYQAAEKEYTGSMVLGKTTPSIDLETDFDGEFPVNHVTTEMLNEAVKTLTGDIEQYPPIYSAIKVGGVRLYKKARKGQEVEIKPRIVTVKTFEIDPTDFPKINFKIVCSKGTYIRSLVRDLGIKVDSGAYMSALCRTRIGEFKIENAHDLDSFVTQKRAEKGLA
jgi:tRNA pseudouridine55 synthase